MLSIKILGSGCENCRKVEAIAHQVVSELGVEAEFDHVTDPEQIYSYPILGTPGLVINEKVVSAGRIPGKDEVYTWITTALA